MLHSSTHLAYTDSYLKIAFIVPAALKLNFLHTKFGTYVLKQVCTYTL